MWNDVKWSNMFVIEVLEKAEAEKVYEEKMRNRNTLYIRGLQTFAVKGRMANILGFTG